MMQETQEFNTEMEKFSRLANKIIYTETTAKNLRELAKLAEKMAEMLEEVA